jgi:hypothetical protein
MLGMVARAAATVAGEAEKGMRGEVKMPAARQVVQVLVSRVSRKVLSPALSVTALSCV